MLLSVVEDMLILSAKSNVIDLFNGLACLAALLIRRPHCSLKDHCLRYFGLGMDLMERVHQEWPSARVQKLYQRAKKLEEEAHANVVDIVAALPPIELEVTNLPHLNDHQQNIGNMSDVDFDAWLADFIVGTTAG